MANWAGNFQDVPLAIAKRFQYVEVYFAFRAVCKSWKSAAAQVVKPPFFQTPWLMLPRKFDDKEPNEIREFFSIKLGTKHQFFLPEASSKPLRKCLSCKDWLFVVEGKTHQNSLLHPLSRVQIQLPELKKVQKADISANPGSESDCVVAVIWDSTAQLAFCRPGDSSWTIMDNWLEANGSFFHDVIISSIDGNIYGLDYQGQIVRGVAQGPNSGRNLELVFNTLLKNILGSEQRSSLEKLYLVQLSAGRFLIVQRIGDYCPARGAFCTSSFNVVEVDIRDGSWKEISDLGNKALFLGFNSTFKVEATALNGCEPNCIYFTNGWMTGAYETGVYHLLDGSIQYLLSGKGYSKLTPPAWIGPSFPKAVAAQPETPEGHQPKRLKCQ